jgi:hypothetical protein
MAVVMITCPNTGRPVSTGIESDPRSFACLPDVLSHSMPPLRERARLVDARGLACGGRRR